MRPETQELPGGLDINTCEVLGTDSSALLFLVASRPPAALPSLALCAGPTPESECGELRVWASLGRQLALLIQVGGQDAAAPAEPGQGLPQQPQHLEGERTPFYSLFWVKDYQPQ